MGVRIKKGSSRLSMSSLYKIDGIEFWGRPEVPILGPSNDDKIHIVEDRERIDQISKKYYKRDDWDWIVAYRNNLFLLPCELVPGQKLIIPDPSKIRDGIF